MCAIRTADADVVICPNRLYFKGHHFLREIARDAFSEFDPASDGPDRLPTLVRGDVAVAESQRSGMSQVGVFGKNWSGEVKLPPAAPEGGRFSVDFTLVLVTPDGELTSFVPVEVQTLDTVGSYKSSIAALQDGRRIVKSDVGMNWENVSKRILPQLITKGLMLQGERLCKNGIYFVTPDPVYQRIMLRLNGNGLRSIPKQPGSITFVRYRYDKNDPVDGFPRALKRDDLRTVSTSDMSIAFISPQNLPPAGSYEERLRARIGH